MPTIVSGIIGTWNAPISNATIGNTTYTFTPDPGQCATTATMTISVFAPNIAPVPTQIAPLCQNAPITVSLPTTVSGIIGTWNAPISNATIGNTTYTFTPDPGQCATTATMTISVFAPNIVPTFVQQADICQGDSLPVLTISSNNASGSVSGTWSTTATNTSTAGILTYNFVPNIGQCATAATLTINVIANPVFAISGACQGGAYTLEAASSGAGSTYQWFKNGVALSETDSTIVITKIDTYKCIITENGCTSEQIITPTDIICSVQKGVSPNGDGKNDEFDLSSFDVSKLEIFNRYGMIVYSKSGYKKEWFGQTDAGEMLPDGTYYYVINLNKGETKTGWVYINKASN